MKSYLAIGRAIFIGMVFYRLGKYLTLIITKKYLPRLIFRRGKTEKRAEGIPPIFNKELDETRDKETPLEEIKIEIVNDETPTTNLSNEANNEIPTTNLSNEENNEIVETGADGTSNEDKVISIEELNQQAQLEAQDRYEHNIQMSKGWRKKGFYNDGNTCYQNAVLQCLMQNTCLFQMFQTKESLPTINKSLQELFRIYHNSNKEEAISQDQFRKNLGKLKPEYLKRTQGDSFEYLCDVINLCYDESIKLEDCNGYYESPFIVFEGEMRVSNMCGCSRKINREKFFTITLPIPKYEKACLEDCIKSVLKPSNCHCSICNSGIRTSKSVTKKPLALILHINRFYVVGNNILSNKTPLIKIPEISPSEDFQDYELYAVVKHYGNLTSGHYYTEAKVNGSWFRFNDSIVSPTAVPQPDGSEYILFYKQIEDFEFF